MIILILKRVRIVHFNAIKYHRAIVGTSYYCSKLLYVVKNIRISTADANNIPVFKINSRLTNMQIDFNVTFDCSRVKIGHK